MSCSAFITRLFYKRADPVPSVPLLEDVTEKDEEKEEKAPDRPPPPPPEPVVMKNEKLPMPEEFPLPPSAIASKLIGEGFVIVHTPGEKYVRVTWPKGWAPHQTQSCAGSVKYYLVKGDKAHALIHGAWKGRDDHSLSYQWFKQPIPKNRVV